MGKSNNKNTLVLIPRDIDLNLFPIFDAVYTTGSVKQAAELLSISSSAVSQSIAKLKGIFSDPLFLRDKNHLVATVSAHNLHEGINTYLRSLTNKIVEFRSISLHNKIIIRSSPYLGVRFAPVISAYLLQKKPSYDIVFEDGNNDLLETEKLLLLKQIDLAFGVGELNNTSISSIELTNENIIAVCAKNHPRIKQVITKSQMLSEDFSSIETGNGLLTPFQILIDKEVGLRHYNFSCSSLFVMGSYIANSESVGLIPSWFYEKFKDAFGLKKCRIEFEIPMVKTFMYFNKSRRRDVSFNNLLEHLEKSFCDKGR